MISSELDFGVYIHWPFCKAKCPYCDFNSHVRHEAVDALGFARAIAAELGWLAEQTEDQKVTSIFFGGGTPSLMPPEAVGHVLDAIARLWLVANDAEVTLEANPTSAEAQNFTGYRTAGINRVSVGVQALNDADLKSLGRQHSAEEALAAFRLAARIFSRVSFDMIYARPGQSAEAWRQELSRALAEQQGHMSLYQLTIEPGTAFGALHESGRFPVLPEETASDLYFITQELTEAAGLPAYEISNHAAPGHQSRHNRTYWRYLPYAGAGPGAHSRIGSGMSRRALVAEKHPESWRQLVETRGHGIIEDVPVSSADQALEYLLMGLRISEGIDLERHAALAGETIAEERITELVSLGLVTRTGSRLIATPRGRPVLNAIIARLVA
jgi:oxygen-independent coproporphyrinogen-3 oxidase